MLKNSIKKLNNLTLFDRLLIIFVILGAIIFTSTLFRKSSYVTVTIQVGENSLLDEPRRYGEDNLSWFAELFHNGMKEIDGLGRVSAEVLSVNSYDTYPRTKTVLLTTRLKTVHTKSSNQYTYKGSVVSVGASIKLNLDNLSVEGIITHMDGVDNSRKPSNIIVDVKLIKTEGDDSASTEVPGVEEYIANAYSVGDQIKDKLGNVLIKIVDKRVENAKRIVTTSSGDILVRRHPLRYDVYLKLEISADEIDGRYYLFNDLPILIGENIPLNTAKASTTPVITAISVK